MLAAVDMGRSRDNDVRCAAEPSNYPGLRELDGEIFSAPRIIRLNAVML